MSNLICPNCGRPKSWHGKLCKACNVKTRVRPLEERFWRHVIKGNGDECWGWRGATSGNGYGTINAGPEHGHAMRPAHRVSWGIHFGPIPEGMFVCHKCDNRSCTRPDHLFLGTMDDNRADMFAKGREARGDRHGAKTHPERWVRGERCWKARLTIEQVQEIRRDYVNGKTPSAIAHERGLETSHIHSIVRRKIWKHVP